MKIDFTLNGKPVSVEACPLHRLLDVLRENFGLVGVKEGCGEGECGACAVIVNKRLVNSCLVPIGNVHNSSVITIEGFRQSEQFSIISEAFAEAGAVQCGFCTPGMIMAVQALLSQNPEPSRKQIVSGLSGNLCRCTGMNMIVEAVQIAAKKGGGLW